jgi:hypothetical protein
LGLQDLFLLFPALRFVAQGLENGLQVQAAFAGMG